MLRQYQSPPLHLAAANGDAASLSALLAKDPNFDALNWAGHTALRCAARRGQAESIRLLLENGANPNHAEPEPLTTILMEAAWSGSSDAIRILIEGGADPHFQNWQGETALSLAARNGAIDGANFLIDVGVELRLYECALLERLDDIERLVRSGADIDERVRDATPVVIAAVHKRRKSVVLLRQLGARVYDLSEAATIGDCDEVRKMIKEGRSVDEADNWGQTALMMAALHNQTHVLQMLLEYGADPNLSSDGEYTALRWAEARGQHSAAEILRSVTG